MAQEVVIEQYGGPEVLRAREVEIGPPQANEVRLRHTRIGVNFHGVYVRSGLYQAAAARHPRHRGGGGGDAVRIRGHTVEGGRSRVPGSAQPRRYTVLPSFTVSITRMSRIFRGATFSGL